jgi:hypothetical protein
MHPGAEAGDEAAIAGDDDEGPFARVVDGEGDARRVGREVDVVEDVGDRFVIPVKLEGKLGLGAAHPVETLEEVVRVGHALKLPPGPGARGRYCVQIGMGPQVVT